MRSVPLLPLRDIIVFPHMVVPLFVGREKSISALEEAMASDKELLLVAQKRAKTNDPKEEDIFKVGTIGQIIQLLRLPDGTVKVLVEGKRRAQVERYLQSTPYFLCEVQEIDEPDDDDVQIEALMRQVQQCFENYVKLNKRIPPEMLVSVQTIDDPSRLADTIVAHLSLKLNDKQSILETASAPKRLEKLYELMQAEIEILQVEKKIRTRVKKQMEKSQKEYYLNEQMQAIQKELGDRDEFKNELQDLEQRIKNKRMSKEARDRVQKEFKKLKMMSPMSAEATVVRNYIDWILSLPWEEKTAEKMNVVEAEKILEEDHYGLEKVKERVLEYLAVQALVKKLRGPILCLVGPPGVGKTSLARSVARATGRKFVRQSLGGVRDEAEIRGHRRTYIGALPGKIIQSLKKAGANNPVFLLDEIDKMSQDFRGDPASALLEVLDPEQNNAFNDHYVDLDYDLSDVMFITTANTQHQIPLPLQDRLEIITLPGYTEWEKLEIAKQYLIPKQREQNGITEISVEFTDDGIREILHKYTREAGVRNLEREISKVCRKIAKNFLSDRAREAAGKDAGKEAAGKDGAGKEAGKAASAAAGAEGAGKGKAAAGKTYVVDPAAVKEYLGVERHRKQRREDANEIGLANGLAVTMHGGDLLATEVMVVPGKGKLILTGSLGDVMQESAQAALSYVRSRAPSLELDPNFQSKVDAHVHFPEGAIPKDGPSAGITMATALASALLRVPVRQDIAMTGEITLRGRVLPIGGLKEKILAAHRAEIFEVVIPEDNEKELKDIPERVMKQMTVHPVRHMDQVLKLALDHKDPERFMAAGTSVVDWRAATRGKEESADSTAESPVERIPT